MSMPLHRFRCDASQHIGKVAGAETLAGAIDGGKRFLRRDQPVKNCDCARADVAFAARLGVFRKIGQERLSPTDRTLAQHRERGEALMFDPALRFVDFPLVDTSATKGHIVETVEGQRIGGQTIATGAADLLIIALDR